MKTEKSYAAKLQLFNIYFLGISLLLLSQSFSYQLYRLGFVFLFISVPFQVALGNISDTATRTVTIKKTLIYLFIVGIVFVVSIFVTPILVELGRNK